MRSTVVTLISILGVVAYVGRGLRADDKGDVEKELKKFQGSWTFESVETGGKKLPVEPFKGMTIAFTGDKYAVKNGDDAVESATQKIDPSKSPKTMDAKVIDGPN